MEAVAKPKRTHNVVVFDGNPLHNWAELFRDRTLEDGSVLNVVQCSWNHAACSVYPDGAGGCLLHCVPLHETTGSLRGQNITVKPDFVLIRNQARGPTPVTDNRRTLYGLMIAGIPAVNSLASVYQDLERAAMVAELKEIERRVGHDKFPLVPITYFEGSERMTVYDSGYPCVLKVSHAHAGMGKAKVPDPDGFQDVATIIALNQDYCTAEPYVNTAYGIRVQKIGNNYRVYKKVHTGSGWKSHFGGADLQFLELNETFKFWADECAKCYGGMDLLAVDAVCDHDGNYHILELNGSAIGIKSQFWNEDSEAIVELCMDKLNKVYCSASATSTTDDAVSTDEARMTADDWLRHNKEREKQVQELRKLKLELEYERSMIAAGKHNSTSEEWDYPAVGKLLLPLAIGISVGFSIFYLNWHRVNQ